MSGRFEGRAGIVTGASKGIGKACAVQLAAEGAQLVLCARDAENLDTMVRKLESSGFAVTGVAGDANDPETPGRLVAAAIERFGRIDLLVNNASSSSYLGRPHLAPHDLFTKDLVGNSWIGVGMVRAAMGAGLGDGGGAVVNISALAPRKLVPYAALYAAGKSALESLTRALALDLGPQGVRVNAVAPGLTKTPGSHFVWDGQEELQASVVPLGRLGEPEDIARAVAFLLSDDASYITGQVIDVDGGAVLAPGEFHPPKQPHAQTT